MHCHDTQKNINISADGSIALVGHPNVGKSAIFQRLTGQHVAISNYPGTTVEVTRGQARDLPQTTLVDTPGVIAFPPHSEDEVVTAQVLYYENLKAILQVGDAKNLRRTLLLSVQLAEMGLPMVLALNMMDEADTRGVRINNKLLADTQINPIRLSNKHGGDCFVEGRAVHVDGSPQRQDKACDTIRGARILLDALHCDR